MYDIGWAICMFILHVYLYWLREMTRVTVRDTIQSHVIQSASLLASLRNHFFTMKKGQLIITVLKQYVIKINYIYLLNLMAKNARNDHLSVLLTSIINIIGLHVYILMQFKGV